MAVRVVVGEDEPLFREGIVRVLEQAKFEVVGVAGDAPDLLRKTGAHKPDVVITDIEMPPEKTDDGLRAAIEIRRTRPETGVVVLSQYLEDRYPLELVGDRAEGVGYLLKQRVGDLKLFVDSVRRVAAGGTALDPQVVQRMVGRRRAASPLDDLTPREREVMTLMAEGRESSSATLAERDAPALKSWLTGGDEPQVVRAFAWNPERWRTVTTRQQGLYRATIALTLVQRPRDFHTGAPLTPQLIEAGRIDDHHVFPRGYLRSVAKGDHPDSVLNHCLIDRATNIRITNRAPSAYLAEIRAELGATVDEVLRSHGLPVGADSPLLTDDFDVFLDWREQALQEALASATGKAVASAVRSPDRSSLDVEVEGVELELRRIIVDTLDGQADALPGHVAAKIAERITAARRRNPGIGNGHYDSLSGKLEYCDLRELQDVLTSKILWPQFEERFGSKETLNVRFAQLAELRNRLRHSRTVDNVTRKDGEAALLWFRQVLATGY
jgi:DNA-binding NarL/FixJ family response regulator